MRILLLPVPRFSASMPRALFAAGAFLLASLSGCSAAMAPDDNQSETPEAPEGSSGPDTRDPPKPDPATVSIAPATVEEGEHAAFAVTLSRTLPTAVTVNWKTMETMDGKAKAGTDFTEEKGAELVFAAGTARQTILVATIEDELHEPDETFEVALTGVAPRDIVSFETATATGTITDDDPPPDAGPPPDDHGDTRNSASDITPGTPVSGRLGTAADVDYFKVAVPGRRLMFAATDPGRIGDPGYGAGTAVRIETSGVTLTNTDEVDSELVSAGMAYVRVSGAAATRYDLAVWLLEPYESDTSFDIELRYLGEQPTAAQKNIFRAAADVWEEIVTGDLTQRIIIDSRWKCDAGDPSTFGDTIDDLRIDIKLRKIDGPSNTLAIAGPCATREGGLPVIGIVEIDEDDLSRMGTEGLRRVAVHEMAHVLGYGTSDQWEALLANSAVAYAKGNPDAATLPDTHFIGSAAVSAFNEVGGDSYTDGRKVPVENNTARYGEGGLDGHWREAVFGNELLTATISTDSRVSQPLSKVTIASLADLGYRVDLTKAESYALPSTSPSLLRAQAAQDELDLGDHVRRGPVIVVEIPE